MKRVEIFLNNKNSLETHVFKNINDEYPAKIYIGSECYNYIKIMSGNSIQKIRHGIECLTLECDEVLINLNDFDELIKKRGMGPISDSIKKYLELQQLKKLNARNKKRKKVKRTNKYVGVIFVAGIMVVVLLITPIINIFNNLFGKNKPTEVDDKTKIENVIDEEEIKEDYNQEEKIIEQEKQVDQTEFVEIVIEKPMIVSIEYEDRSETKKVQVTKSYYYEVINKYASRYGLDPNLVLAIATQERGIHSSERDSGGATGLMQLQNSVWENEKITAYNFETNSYETLYITEEKIQQLHTNIQIGCMYLQNCMKYMDYNIVAAIQCYNMGKGNMNKILEAYSKDTNKSVEDILSDKYDIGWLEYRNIIKKGDPIYIENVLSWLGADIELTVKKTDNSIVTSNISNEITTKKIC